MFLGLRYTATKQCHGLSVPIPRIMVDKDNPIGGLREEVSGLQTMVDREIDGLRKEIASLRKEIMDARIERAARHLELMRNWMSVYTPSVTLVLVIFGVLGWKSFSDVQSNREKVEATAGQAATLLSNVTNRFELMKKEQDDFEKLVKDNEQVVEQNRTVLQGYRSSVAELEKKQGDIRKDQDELKKDLLTLSAEQRKTANSVTSSVSLSSGIGGIVSNILAVPVITSVVDVGNSSDLIGGFGFGSSQGRVFLKMHHGEGLIDLDLVSQAGTVGGSIEVPKEAFSTWGDNKIIFREPEIDKLSHWITGHRNDLLVQLVTSSGAKSNVYAEPFFGKFPGFENALLDQLLPVARSGF